ncbi:hypothetical protein MJO29_012010 [Puccinia striiformis f. sp. tritici]|nr:hypothetical protein MJO29_012010 [Puccinia striiformis f. sp. tritici]
MEHYAPRGSKKIQVEVPKTSIATSSAYIAWWIQRWQKIKHSILRSWPSRAPSRPRSLSITT